MAEGEFELSVAPSRPGRRAVHERPCGIVREHVPNRLSRIAARAPMPRIFRFCLVGTVNTGLYFGLYIVLREVCFYLVSHVLAFLTAMVVSFFLHCSVTFRTRPTLRKFLLFPLSNVTGFAVQTVGLSVLVGVVGMNPAYAPLPAMAAAVPVTFLVARLVLLDHRGARHHRGVAALVGAGA